ncbi:hypothetical protein DFJ74DRAFT_733522 [Hyaloraphidium curvatum]|nr:hypothetical protein DFJ74DRAFT_733522 [Hyaloraphidium curvatum]
MHRSSRVLLLLAALAALLAVALASPLEPRDGKAPPPPPPPPPKKHDGYDHAKKVTKTVYVTVNATRTATATLIPTAVPFAFKCKLPVYVDDGKKDGGHFEYDDDHKKGEIVKLEYLGHLGGYVYKCDGVFLVFVVKLKAWFLIDIIEICPEPPAPKKTSAPEPPKKTSAPQPPTSKKHYARDGKDHPRPPKKEHNPHPAKKDPEPKKQHAVTATVTQTAVRTVTVKPPCVPATCELPDYEHGDGKKGEDGYFFFEDGKDRKVVELIYVKLVDGYIYKCGTEIYIFLVKPHKWYKITLISLIFPPPPLTSKPLPPTTKPAPPLTSKPLPPLTSKPLPPAPTTTAAPPTSKPYPPKPPAKTTTAAPPHIKGGY